MPMPRNNGPVVLAGASGILGGAVAARVPADERIDFGRTALDPADADSMRTRIVALAPRLVINCAADTDVEGAEAAPERAFAVNTALAGALAATALEAGATMLHFSSTGCYGAWKDEPYTENDPLRPTTVHHRSKAAGEEAVLRAHPDALILRIGWLFGGRPGQKKNFVWARLAEAAGRPEIGANPAQRGNPTAADDVASLALQLIDARVSGIFNCVGRGEPASRLDYVAAILAIAESTTRVVPAAFVRRASVSHNEMGLNAGLAAVGMDSMPLWRDSLGAYVRGVCGRL